MKKKLLTVFLAFLFGNAVISNAAENLVKNGALAGPVGKDGMPVGWGADGSERAAVKYDPETKCFRIDVVTQAATIRQGGLKLDPGKTYRLSCQMKTEDFDGGGGVTIINSGWKWTCGFLLIEAVTADWTKLETVFKPAPSDNGEYQVTIYSSGSDGRLFIKDISLELAEGAAIKASAGEQEEARKARQKPVYSAHHPLLNICLRDGRMRCLVSAVVTNSSPNAGSMLVCIEERDGEKWHPVASTSTTFSGTEGKRVAIETPVELVADQVISSLFKPARILRITGRGAAGGRAYFKLPVLGLVKPIKLSIVDQVKPEIKCETMFGGDPGNKGGKVLITVAGADGERKTLATRECQLKDETINLDLQADKLPNGRLSAQACVKNAGGKTICSQELIFARLSKEPERLNNLVCRLEKGNLKLKNGGQTEMIFENPRDGWVWIKLTAKQAQSWWGRLFTPNETGIITVAEGNNEILKISAGGAGEAMRWLGDGIHRLTVSGTAAGEIQYEIRSVPELNLSAYNSSPLNQNKTIIFGPYDENYLAKNGILNNVNGMMNPYLNDRNKNFEEEWIKNGGRWGRNINPPFNYGTEKKDEFTSEDVFKAWTQNRWVSSKLDLVNGYFVDEFTGCYESGIKLMRWAEGMRLMLADQRFKDKMIYPYLSTFASDIPDYINFVKALHEVGTRPCFEWYPGEEPTEEKAGKVFAEFRKNMVDYERQVPGLLEHSLFTLSFTSMVGVESCDVYPDVDYKVFLDLQFNMLVNDPLFRDLGGVQWYTSAYTDDETMRWCSALFRHYAIEGRRDKLSEKYGFKYNLRHLANGDFEKGLEDWETKPATEGNIAVKIIKNYGRFQSRYNAAPEVGDHVLWMKSSAGGPNIAAQAIKGLEAGKLYSLKMISGDYGELMAGKSAMTNHVLSVKVEGADVIPNESFTGIMKKGWKDKNFDDVKNPYYMHYHWMVFRAKGNEARLTISDWAGDRNPGGPEGQELICNFIQVQPYFPKE